ncbi:MULTISPECIES: hypothetical protein [Bacillaceae]|uniref:hypothetical protein n=1 Tax=Bacillaceae TaxID=186817 RepID=UPI0006D2AAAD|nr:MULTISPECIES: hypothetical protein [Bacillaceae]
MKGNSDVSFHAYIRGIIFIGFALLQLGMIISGSIQYPSLYCPNYAAIRLCGHYVILTWDFTGSTEYSK